MPDKEDKIQNRLNDAKNEPQKRGAVAMLGFAKRFRPTRTTEDWMAELRETEK